MKMKRIKLFEAFSDECKIEETNITFLMWIIRSYIDDADLEISINEVRGTSLDIKKDGYRQFSYYPDRNTISDINIESFYPILSKYKSFNLVNIPNARLRTFFRKSGFRVLRKLYQDEKSNYLF